MYFSFRENFSFNYCLVFSFSSNFGDYWSKQRKAPCVRRVNICKRLQVDVSFLDPLFPNL